EYLNAAHLLDETFNTLGLRPAQHQADGRQLGRKAQLALAICVGNRGLVSSKLGDFDQALTCYTEAEAIFRGFGNLAGVASNVGSRGTLYQERGDFDRALACLAEAEGISRKLGNRAGIA